MKKEYYQKEIDKTRKELGDLQNSPAALERFAREHYLMKKEGEDIFIIEDSTTGKK
jgi:cell division protein FtsB